MKSLKSDVSQFESELSQFQPPLFPYKPGRFSLPSTDVISKSFDVALGFAKNRRDWNESLRDLTNELERICGARRHRGLSASLSLPASGTSTPSLWTRHVQPWESLTNRRHDNRPECCHDNRRDGRTIFVRHLETHQDLENKLFLIWRNAPTPEVEMRSTSGDLDDVDDMSLGPDAVCIYDTYTGLESHRMYHQNRRVQVKIGKMDVEDLVVAVRDQRHLTVEAISGSGRQRQLLYDALLSDELSSGALLCFSTGNGFLNICPQPSTLVEEKFVGTGSVFVPVIRRNELSLELTIVLHIPHNFRFDDVIVKTIDDRLLVTGRKRPVSLPVDVSEISGSLDTVPPAFRVFVQLPPEVISRSVSASLTDDHQLIVKGKMETKNTLTAKAVFPIM